MIMHLTIYVQCQRVVPIQEVVCPFGGKVENMSVEVGGVHAELTFQVILLPVTTLLS